MATTEERLSRLEGVYDHLATKADIAGTKADIADTKSEIVALEGRLNALASEMRSEFRIHRWVLGLLFALNLLILGRVFEIISL